MSIPQKSLLSLLSLCQKFYNRSKFGKVLTKNKFAQFFFETRCISCYFFQLLVVLFTWVIAATDELFKLWYQFICEHNNS